MGDAQAGLIGEIVDGRFRVGARLGGGGDGDKAVGESSTSSHCSGLRSRRWTQATRPSLKRPDDSYAKHAQRQRCARATS